MNTVIAVILGIVIGFLVEWVVDWFYQRRKARALQTQLDELNKEKRGMENQLTALKEENQHFKELYGAPDEEDQELPVTDEQALQEDEAGAGWVPAFLDDEESEAEPDGEEKLAPEAELMETPAVAQVSKESYDIRDVDIIGPVYGEKLRAIEIDTPLELLKRGSSANGRAEIAEELGITKAPVLEWVNHAELYQLDGMSTEYANALKSAGVDTAMDLATSDPEALHENLETVYKEKKIDSQSPSDGQVSDWINQAKSLPNVATYMALRSKSGSE